MEDHKEPTLAESPTVIYGQNYTYTDYLKFTFDEMVEIIRGKIFRMSEAPNTTHQNISRNISGILYIHLQGRICTFFSAPYDVILPTIGKDYMNSDKVVQPDISVICNPDKIKEKGCFGAPDWIIEIISPSTAKKDYQIKFSLYEEAGVGEYWLIEPYNQTIEVFVLRNAKYERINTYIGDDIITSHTIPDLQVDLKQVFRQDFKNMDIIPI